MVKHCTFDVPEVFIIPLNISVLEGVIVIVRYSHSYQCSFYLNWAFLVLEGIMDTWCCLHLFVSLIHTRFTKPETLFRLRK